MARKSVETLVGAIVVLGIVSVAFLALSAANLVSFSSTRIYSVRALFDDIGGLKKNAPVRCAGVSVGQVTSITLDQDTYQALVTMEINGSVQLPVDSSVKILSASMLGDEYVGIEPGSDDKKLANGDLIKKTQSAVVLENVIGQLIFDKAAEAGFGSTPATGASLAPAPPAVSAAASRARK